MDHDLLVTLKALSDASRLRIVGLLAARPAAVEELAENLALAPGTVVHHLKRLSAAGLVESPPRRPYVEYALNVDRLHQPRRIMDQTERGSEQEAHLPGPSAAPLPAFEAEVLRPFFGGGRLPHLP